MNCSRPYDKRILLGVNVDHVATVRQARGTPYPSVLHAALAAEQAGADSITAHLREDRRHIQDVDIALLRSQLQTRLNLEMAVTDEMVALACRVRPHAACLVPERRAELTTEGGLDVVGNFDAVARACAGLGEAGVRVSLFIDADPSQVDAARRAGAPVIELHTGRYADALTDEERTADLRRLAEAAMQADQLGLTVHAGHGLNYHNVQAICQIPQLCELNIGHSIIARALMVGIERAVSDMRKLLDQGRCARI